VLSSKTRYATRAILELSLKYNEGPVLVGEIADRQNIPSNYLHQILVSLRLAGFVRSQKGPGGGYRLARAPHEITLGQVVRAMHGTIAPVTCVSISDYMVCGCPHPDKCSLRASFREARDAMAEVLDHTTFGDLAGTQRCSDDAVNVVSQSM
jgi:Rrf2 family protein